MRARAKILFVDDSSDNRLILRTILEDDYDLVEAATVVTALQLMAEEKFDLVISDVLIRESNGLELVEAMRHRGNSTTGTPGETPFILLTRPEGIGFRERVLAAGANDYQAKPIVDMASFFERIERWLPDHLKAGRRT